MSAASSATGRARFVITPTRDDLIDALFSPFPPIVASFVADIVGAVGGIILAARVGQWKALHPLQ